MGANCAPEAATQHCSIDSADCAPLSCRPVLCGDAACGFAHGSDAPKSCQRIIREDAPPTISPRNAPCGSPKGDKSPSKRQGAFAGKSPPNRPSLRGTRCPGGVLQVRLLAGHDLPGPNGHPDAPTPHEPPPCMERYVIVRLEKTQFRTHNVDNMRSPVFYSGNYFRFSLDEGGNATLVLSVVDKTRDENVKVKMAGSAYVNICAFQSYDWVKQGAPLLEGRGELFFESCFEQCDLQPSSNRHSQIVSLPLPLSLLSQMPEGGAAALPVTEEDATHNDGDVGCDFDHPPLDSDKVFSASDAQRHMRLHHDKGNLDAACLLACLCVLPLSVEQTIQHGADVNACDDNMLPLVYFAVTSGCLKTLRSILQWDMQQTLTASFFDWEWDHKEWTLLMLALLHGHHDIYEFLLREMGCQLRLISPSGLPVCDREQCLACFPEIHEKEQVPKPEVLVVNGRRYEKCALISDAEFEEACAQRVRARDFLGAWFEERDRIKQLGTVGTEKTELRCPGGELQVRMIAGYNLPTPYSSRDAQTPTEPPAGMDRYIIVRLEKKQHRTQNVGDMCNPIFSTQDAFSFLLEPGSDVNLVLSVVDKINDGKVKVRMAGRAYVELCAFKTYDWLKQSASLLEGRGELLFETSFKEGGTPEGNGCHDSTTASKAASPVNGATDGRQ